MNYCEYAIARFSSFRLVFFVLHVNSGVAYMPKKFFQINQSMTMRLIIINHRIKAPYSAENTVY